MLKKIVQVVGGDPHKREIEKYANIVEEINNLENEYEALDKDALRGKTEEFRSRLTEGETLDDILVEAFAAVREASKRTIGLRHYDIQLVGGIALHQGKIAEMRTGEGKTLVATLPLYLNALTENGVHLVTVNDYLARRDARWMGPIYNALGMSIGVLQMAARTEHGKKAFLVDLERESPHEDQHQLQMVPRREAYAADITYGTNSEFGFDYLRDNMTMSMAERVQRGHFYCIIDEVDNVLIDEARTPLIISGPAQDEAEWYLKMAQIVKQLRPVDYEINEKDRNVNLTELGEVHVEELLNMPLRDPDRPEDITPEQARMLGYLEQALRAQYLFRRNKDYLLQAGKVVIVDEFTGRLMPGRRWSDGLHQAVEAKEGVRVQAENVTYATITIQNYYRMYEKLSGMTGTAVTEAEEFDKIYNLDVLAIPTNLEYQASSADSELVVLEDRDEYGYKYTYYADRDDPDKTPVFWKRKDYPDIVYRTEETKLRAVTREVVQYHIMGRPILLGTTSVELSERLSTRLRAEPLRRLAQLLIIRDAWFEVNDRIEDGRQVEELQYLNGPLNDLQTSEMRSMARELGLSFNPEESDNLDRLLSILNLTPDHKERLVSILQGGIPHQVLNARKHTEESQIITGAGAYGALTIATNMAGRGVDIKLGGELAEEILSAINRVLRRAGYEDPYDMSLEDRRQALLDLDPAQYGIYETEINYFYQYIEDMERVRDLGGLHVIGSERHEARRIDNQLRGRSSRQGDPGSSRFYLSMEDELMRLFGGQQADNMMQRMKIDDAMPLEVGLVGRIVEQSQTRVEGANFDVRKHLLEYDDVLNTQRAKIYAQRDRIFTKDDLNEDVTDMLRVEINRRVPQALEEEDGPWRLLAWMDQIQPAIQIDGILFPSYTMKLLVEHLTRQWSGKDDGGSPIKPQEAIDALLAVASQSLEAEENQLIFTVNRQLDLTQDRYEEQVRERQEAVDTFFEALDLEDETDTRSPRQILDELSSVARIPLRLSSQEQRALKNDPYEIVDEVQNQIEAYLQTQSVTRLIGLIERRLEQSLGLNPAELANQDWNETADQVIGSIHDVYDQRRQRLVGEDQDGQIAQDLENALSKHEGPLDETAAFRLLMLIPQGSKATFDKKTHRRVFQRTTRLTYVYYAAQFLVGRDAEDIIDEILEHLETAQRMMHTAWGRAEWKRVADSSIAELDKKTQRGLVNVLGEDTFTRYLNMPMAELDLPIREAVAMELGRQALTEVYRQLLLYVITELWVDYLTQMEALRVSIGLEAYAQRDPLVQYKNRAYELFQELVDNMRISVVTRMYTFRPRDLSSVQTTVTRPEPPKIEASVPAKGTDGRSDQEKPKAKSKKRRRRRRR
jgi:preprotein translocase subunit SecA